MGYLTKKGNVGPIFNKEEEEISKKWLVKKTKKKNFFLVWFGTSKNKTKVLKWSIVIKNATQTGTQYKKSRKKEKSNMTSKKEKENYR